MIYPSGGPMRAIVLFLLLMAFSTVTSMAQPAPPAPELNCAQPSKVEAAICSDPALLEREHIVRELLPVARFDALGHDTTQQQERQTTWLRRRDDHSCGLPSINECLMILYNGRLEELAVATLFRDPPKALTALRLVNPNAAPLYEAIYDYATIDDADRRTQAVATVIAPLFEKIHDSPEGGLAPLSDIKSAGQAAAGDKPFSIFVGMAGSGSNHLTMPCEALIRRPGLLYALGPFSGGALDGFLPRSDCDARLPKLPLLTDLVQAASAAAVCPGGRQGTLRFSVWRYVAKLVLAARLHQPENWKSETQYRHFANEREQGFWQAQDPSIERAKDAVAAYFTKFFKVSPDVAGEQASDVVEKIVSTSFYQCGG